MDFACLKGGQIVVIALNMVAKDLKTWKVREIENVEYQELHDSSLGSCATPEHFLFPLTIRRTYAQTSNGQ